MMHELRFFLPRNSASHSVEVQPCRATPVKVLSLCRHQSAPVACKALSVKASPATLGLPGPTDSREKSLHFPLAVLSPFIIGYR